ncbi:hypothetical protein EUGRSUZ_K02613 [Eucalyptus grandis]|uniref:Uncharacterized protein n=2 Tax=Eucalyptus grandis TaxID=71139 RepID=A0ACC3IUW2_EUCGR|nr:hypothetical protein EUGRSUZ_K02613 [Eucalyptus grandis]
MESDPDAAVRVPDGEVELEVVAEGVGGGEVELGELRVGDVELDEVGAEDEPEDEGEETDGDHHGEDEVEDELEEAAATAADAAPAAAGAVVGVLLGGHGGAVVGAVEVGLLLRHGKGSCRRKRWRR